MPGSLLLPTCAFFVHVAVALALFPATAMATGKEEHVADFWVIARAGSKGL